MPKSYKEPDTIQDSLSMVDGSSSDSSSSPTNSKRIAKIRRLRKSAYMLSSSTDLADYADPQKLSKGDVEPDERSPLLMSGSRLLNNRRGTDARLTPRPRMSRHQSASGSLAPTRHHSRAGSWSTRLVNALKAERNALPSLGHDGLFDHSTPRLHETDDRVWYDQFTSTDWVHDNIADAFRLKELRSRKDIRGRLFATFDGAQGWILCALVGCITAMIAYIVDVSESPAFDLKDGYCADGWYKSERTCCPGGTPCHSWLSWSTRLNHPLLAEDTTEFLVFIFFCILFSTIACLLTLTTKTTVSSTFKLSTLDENLGALDRSQVLLDTSDTMHSPKQAENLKDPVPPMTYYSASGSGVAEVKVILSGFVLHGFLGLKTLVIKTMGLILSVASGLSLGKEGPFVHVAACVGNISCRLFSKYDQNDGKRREILSAAAASGVAVAFGAPIGGVLFSLEEASYFFPAKTLFRTFFCCICATLTLKALNPYGTHKVAMFEVRYLSDWEFFEMIPFIGLGVLGGACGAFFIKASSFWARSFRKIHVVKRWPLLEVISVALVTGLISYWSPLTKSAVAKLLLGLASDCDNLEQQRNDFGICPTEKGQIMGVVRSLGLAFLIKGFLTIITFGIKVPAGIYVPSMVVGGLLGRLVGHLVQYTVLHFPNAAILNQCAAHPSGMSCVTPGVYSLITAGATMCGVTRLSVTLAIILFELTGSLDYVLPFSLTVLVAKWTADYIEPLSIYDLLTNMNSYPFLNNKTKPIFTSDLGDILPRVRPERIIDISHSPTVSAFELRDKLQLLHEAGELDGGLPIIRDDILVGLIPAPDLEYALDNLDSLADESQRYMCLMTPITRLDDDVGYDSTDFTPYVDPAPMALDIKSPMDLVYECFAKLGLRYICVLDDGQYAGMIHRKLFVHYVRELEEAER